jgi:SAM-dependent methyltransferase
MTKISLNLGCGKKIYKSTPEEAWINVDIVDPPGVSPSTYRDPRFEDLLDGPRDYFLKSDLVNLKAVMEDEYADHIFTSHVVEHIPPYDLEETLREWFRVLKPGGTVAFEMPDVIKCAINLLQILSSKDQTLCVRMGLLGFYGEQKKETPYMIHRWGWTFRTLKPVLEMIGFTDVVEATPVTHMGPVRDFRIEARKPT